MTLKRHCIKFGENLLFDSCFLLFSKQTCDKSLDLVICDPEELNMQNQANHISEYQGIYVLLLFITYCKILYINIWVDFQIIGEEKKVSKLAGSGNKYRTRKLFSTVIWLSSYNVSSLINISMAPFPWKLFPPLDYQDWSFFHKI